MTYTAKKPHKMTFQKEDGTFDSEGFENKLFLTDTFSFGTKIGQITNTVSTIVGMIPMFYDGSEERKVLENRVKAGCAAQSRQIDKTKIGESVKELATVCRQFQHIKEEDSLEEADRKRFLNSILADKKPYFFKYKYRQLNKELNTYNKNAESNCQTRFYMSFKELNKIRKEHPEQLTEEQRNFLFYYDKFLPVLDSPCVMNKVCHYIESVDFEIKKKVRSSEGFDWRCLVSENFQPEKKLTEDLLKLIEDEFDVKTKDIKEIKVINASLVKKNGMTQKEELDKDAWTLYLRGKLEEICSNSERLANHLVYIFYEVRSGLNKSVLWNIAGKQIFENIRNRTNSFYFPVKNENGSLRFLYDNYSIERIMVDDIIDANEIDSIDSVDGINNDNVIEEVKVTERSDENKE